MTLELSDDKTPNPNDLPMLWDANYPSLLNYMEQSLYGIRGIVTDSITGNPLKAKIEINNHDVDSSHVYSNLPIGNYHRYLYQGNYSLTYSKNGYYPKTINVTILNNDIVIEDVELVPFGNTTSISEIATSKSNNIINIDILGRKLSEIIASVTKIAVGCSLYSHVNVYRVPPSSHPSHSQTLITHSHHPHTHHSYTHITNLCSRGYVQGYSVSL